MRGCGAAPPVAGGTGGGGLREIKRDARRQTVRIRVESGDYSFLDRIPGVMVRDGEAGDREVRLPAELEPNRILTAAAVRDTVVEYSLGYPSLRDIYLDQVGDEHA